MKILVFGEILWDICGEERTIGGAPFNFAAHLALLGETVRLVTAVGRDALGDEAIRCAERFGIGTEEIARNDRPTGQCRVTLSADGVPRYRVLSDVAYDHIPGDAEMLARVRAFAPDALVFGTLCQRSPVSRAALAAILAGYDFPEIFCDLNIREGCADAESIGRCLASATVLKVSDEEAHALYDFGLLRGGMPMEAELTARYPNLRQIVVTLGADGSHVLDCASGRCYASGKPAPVAVVSTVGAGDCYGATYFHGYLRGDGIPASIRAATERSSRVVAAKAAVPFSPSDRKECF